MLDYQPEDKTVTVNIAFEKRPIYLVKLSTIVLVSPASQLFRLAPANIIEEAT